MLIGTLESLVANLHIGALKSFGFPTAMLDCTEKSSVKSVELTEDQLNNPQIQAALRAGVVTFTYFPSPEESSEEEGSDEKDPSSEEVTSKSEQNDDSLESEDETDSNGAGLENAEEFEALMAKLNAGEANESDVDILFNKINEMKAADAKWAIEQIENNVELLSKLSENGKLVGTQKLAKNKLKTLLG